MRVLAVRAPYRSDGPNPERARPILPVKIGGEIEAYAAYDQGFYKFPIDDDVAADLDAGRFTVVFQYDCEEVVAVRLIGDPQRGDRRDAGPDDEEQLVFTDQDQGPSS